MAVKSVGWKADFMKTLQELVYNVDIIVTHTFALSKLIFLKELEGNDTFMLLDTIDETTKWSDNFQEAMKKEYESRKIELKKIANFLFKKLLLLPFRKMKLSSINA
jgi:hypothetical protein